MPLNLTSVTNISEGYSEDDIFNDDETWMDGLFFKMKPDKTFEFKESVSVEK